jgi:putative hemolysin
VYRGTPDQVFGVVRVKDLVGQFVRNTGLPEGRLEPMVRPVPRIPANLPADRIIGVLRAKRAHLAIVVDKDASDKVVGMVTIHDVIGALL